MDEVGCESFEWQVLNKQSVRLREKWEKKPETQRDVKVLFDVDNALDPDVIRTEVAQLEKTSHG